MTSPKFTERYDRIVQIIEDPYYHNRAIQLLPDGCQIIIPTLCIGGKIKKDNDSGLSYSLIDFKLSNRGNLKLYSDGNAEIIFEPPKNELYFNTEEQYISMKGKIVIKILKAQ
jgi:hypothetical protein